MGIIGRILGLLPKRNWCGCKSSKEVEQKYQFRAEPRSSDPEEDTFQLRKKEVCHNCSEKNISVVIEGECSYYPERVLVEKGYKDKYGYMSYNKMARLLIELQLYYALETDLSTSGKQILD